jgi:DNA repair exonuclease SbcCD nuclease subunit
MKRTRHKPTAIITSDWHLRESTPVARTDDFWQTQWKKVSWVSELQKKYDCPVLHAGDLFDHWKPSPYLLTYAMKHLPDQFYTIYGNHDLPQHSLEQHEKCGIDVLVNANKVIIPTNRYCGVHWGQTPPNNPNSDILLWHTMTWDEEHPYPGSTDSPAWKLFEKYDQFKLMIIGHNHKRFVIEEDSRVLINPGGIVRQKADEVDDEPRVYLYYEQLNKVEPVYLPFEKNAITRHHIEKKQQRDERVAAFVEKLDMEWDNELSFEQNLERFEAEHEVENKVMELVYKAVEQEI